MNWKEFIIDLMQILSWPFTVIFVLFFLRKHMDFLVQALRNFKYKDLELQFETSVNEIKEQLHSDDTKDFKDRDIYQQLAGVSPRAVILEAWLRLEKEAVDKLKSEKGKIHSADLKSPLKLMTILIDNGLLTSNEAEQFDEIRNLRNIVTHVAKLRLGSENALSYAHIAADLAEAIRTR